LKYAQGATGSAGGKMPADARMQVDPATLAGDR